MSKSIKIDDDIHAWLFDHRNTKEPHISDVIKGLIALKEGSASIERQSTSPL